MLIIEKILRFSREWYYPEVLKLMVYNILFSMGIADLTYC